MGGLLTDLVANGKKGQGCTLNGLLLVDEFRIHNLRDS